jgi:NADH dehydrogenase [ubiquinone] 1 alpha subcomplex assembly factor 7
MTQLKEIIIEEIRQNGAMGLDKYMSMCLGHQDHGYYMKKDPLGAYGDFTTAPEISQLFGDMIGLWVLNTYLRFERPLDITLIECGPGRGTLMSDILRIANQDLAFKHAVKVHMVETSPTLRKLQQTALSYSPDIECEWHESINSIDIKGPVIIIGNEFLDALPFKQFQFLEDKGWHEIYVNDDEKHQNLVYGLKKNNDITTTIKEYNLRTPEANEVFEYSPVRELLTMQIAGLVEQHKGTALLIDYGHFKSDYGDTFQAIHNHQYTNPLEKSGDADLTSHVDFQRLIKLVNKMHNLEIMPLITQGEFLKSLGLEMWHQKLTQKLKTQEDIDQLQAQKHRLIDAQEMGELFKVFCIEKI